MNKYFLPLWTCICTCFFLLNAQETGDYATGYFAAPLDIELKLSGTFGELRSNHFHSGLDIKTNQRTGLPVKASARGYVSRIKIERYGYGKAIYITHPNGYTTVYAHLEKFAPQIEAFVKEQQYLKESYEIQLFPDDNKLRVEQGDLIAFSGNTGGSGGPHLHFEIRDANAKPINPMLLGLRVADTRKPLVKQVMAYPLDKHSTINGKNEKTLLRLIPQKNGTFKTEKWSGYGNIGIGVNTSDRQNTGPNQNGVYKITTQLNGREHFCITFDTYAFNETRFLNNIIDYSFFKKHKSRITKLFKPRGNYLSLYQRNQQDGILELYNSGSTSMYNITISDYEGNESIIIMNIDHDDPMPLEMMQATPNTELVASEQSFTKKWEHFTLSIPKGALYNDEFLELAEHLDTLTFHHDEIPLHKNAIISFDASAKAKDSIKQYFIARITPWGAAYHVPTKRKGAILTARTRIMGTYALTKDDIPPTITPKNFNKGKWMSNQTALKLTIKDDQSGIDGYRATINGKFALMEYDYKTNTLTHDFSDNIVTDTENHLKVIVTDHVGNSTTFESIFYRKPQ